MMREYFSGKLSASEVAKKYKVSVALVYQYAKKLEKAGVSRAHVKKLPTQAEWSVIAKRVSSHVEKTYGHRANTAKK